jgi:hypothetical protein
MEQSQQVLEWQAESELRTLRKMLRGLLGVCPSFVVHVARKRDTSGQLQSIP